MEGSIQLPFALQSPLFKKLEQVADLDSLSKEERREYDHALKQYRDTVCGFIGAIEHGEKIGLEKGRKEGLEKGRKEGLKEGRKEGLFETARNLKSMGMTRAVIRQATGLSDEELDTL